jgi:uncharacterized protein
MSIVDQTRAVVDSEYIAAWQAWRDDLEGRRQDPYGFLAYSAIFKLGTEPTRFPGVPGVWSTSEDGPFVILSAGETLAVGDETITGQHQFAPVIEREFRRAARAGDVVIELSKRGGQDLLRPIDPAHDLRSRYVNTPAYAPSQDWVVAGEFVPFDPPRDIAIDAAVDGIVHSHQAVGELVFELDGVEQRLVVFSQNLAGDVTTPVEQGFTVLTDGTSGITTYQASRRLGVSLPITGGPVTLDFNRTSNLQCAYTSYSPCPLAPAQNRLSVSIEAGEQIPVFRD